MNKEIGNKLRIAREEAGLKQDDVAKVINSTFQKISSFETGRTRVGIEILAVLCKLYEVDVNYILGIKKHEPAKQEMNGLSHQKTTLTADAKELIECYQLCDAEDKEELLLLARHKAAKNTTGASKYA